MNYNEKIKRLEELKELMQKENVNVEESLKAYEEGVKIYKELKKYLDEVDEKIEKL